MNKNKIFISDNEILMSEWDWEKNNQLGLFPDKLAYKSNKKVWWKCNKGHSWDDEIYHRTDGRGCPYCSNKRVLVGYNDLGTLYPELLEEWDYEANVDIKPEQFVVGSAKVVNWICSQCGHKWPASIRNRTQRKEGCPICASKKRAKARRDTILKKKGGIKDPLLLKEWNYEKNGDLRPEQFTEGSGDYVHWVCSKCGHKWRAKILNRTLNKRGCPACANLVVVKGQNDLATTHPQLAAEWHPTLNGDLTPDKVTYGMGEKVWWLCPFGHEYPATILHRSSGTNCPICNSGRQTSFAEQAIFYYIKKIYPDAINRYTDIFDNRMELDIYIPSRRIAIEYDGVFWHKNDKVKREQLKYQICQKNDIKLIRVKEGEIYNKHTADRFLCVDEIETEKGLTVLIQLLLDELDPRSNMWTRKDPRCIHSPVLVNLDRDRFEIMEYRKKNIKDSLAELRPDLVEEWHPTKNGNLNPGMFTLGSGTRVWWLCKKCGHEWKTLIQSRTSGSGCNVCFRRENRGGSHVEAKCVYQYTLDGKFIRKWDCISQAGRELKINSSNISMCAKHKRPNAGGFRWEYELFEELKPIVKVKKSRKGINSVHVLQLDDGGNIVAEYNSLNEAGEKLGIHPSNISKVLHGVQQYAGGYKWKYKK